MSTPLGLLKSTHTTRRLQNQGVRTVCETTEPMHLAQLSGAVLVWEDADGDKHRVEFDE